jgi:hypothetical protein
MNNMIPITKKSSYKIEVWHSDESQQNHGSQVGFKPCNFINMTLTFKSEYTSALPWTQRGPDYYEFRYDKRNKLIEIGTNFRWSTAFKNRRFKLLAECLYMSQTRLINRLIATARVEMSYAELPF